MPRRGSSSGRSSGSSTRACRARRSRSSTGPTRSRGCSRTRWSAREIAYQVIGGTKFYERAEIKDAIAYLTVLANPQDVGLVHARGQLAAARDRADLAVAGDRATRRRWASRLGRGRRRPGACPASGTAAVKALGRFMETMDGLRERAARQDVAGRRPARGACCTRPATSRRWRPSGRSRPRAGSRTSRSSSRSAREFDARAEPERGHARRLPAADRARRRRRHARATTRAS